jgi:hypothetical protein
MEMGEKKDLEIEKKEEKEEEGEVELNPADEARQVLSADRKARKNAVEDGLTALLKEHNCRLDMDVHINVGTGRVSATLRILPID